MLKFSAIAAKPAALIVLTCMTAMPAQAGPAIDVYSHNTSNSAGIRPPLSSSTLKHDAETPRIGAGALAMMNNLDSLRSGQGGRQTYGVRASYSQPTNESRIFPRPGV
jgi:hypothetical protein